MKLYIPKYCDPNLPQWDEREAKAWFVINGHRAKAIEFANEHGMQEYVKLAARRSLTEVNEDIRKEYEQRGRVVKEAEMDEEDKHKTTIVTDDWKRFGISAGEARFVAEYCVNGFNPVSAYLTTMNPRCPPNMAVHHAAAVLRKPGVNSCITEFTNRFIGDKIDQLKRKVIDYYWEQAFYDVSDFIEPDGTIKFKDWDELPDNLKRVVKSIKKKIHGKDADVETVEIELADRDNAIAKLLKLLEVEQKARERQLEQENMGSNSALANTQKIFKRLKDERNGKQSGKEEIPDAEIVEDGEPQDPPSMEDLGIERHEPEVDSDVED